MNLAMYDYDTGWQVRRCDPITVRQWKVEPLVADSLPSYRASPSPPLYSYRASPGPPLQYSLIGHHPLPSYGVPLCPPWGPALHFLRPQPVIQYTTPEYSHHERTYNYDGDNEGMMPMTMKWGREVSAGGSC